MALIEIARTTTMAEILRAHPSTKVGLVQRHDFGDGVNRSHIPTAMLVEIHPNWMRE